METFKKRQKERGEGLKTREEKILSEWGLRGLKKILFRLSFGLDVARNYFPAVLLTRNNMKKGLTQGNSFVPYCVTAALNSFFIKMK